MIKNKKTKLAATCMAAAMSLSLIATGCGKKAEYSANNSASVTQNSSSSPNSEKKSYPALAEALKKDMKPQDPSKDRYYYEKADLNGDGKEEIIALLIGPDFSGTGGNTLCIYKDSDKGLELTDSLNLVQPPVYILKSKHHGYNDIALEEYGGGAERNWKIIEYRNGHYEKVEEAAKADKPAESDILKTLFTADYSQDADSEKAAHL